MIPSPWHRRDAGLRSGHDDRDGAAGRGGAGRADRRSAAWAPGRRLRADGGCARTPAVRGLQGTRRGLRRRLRGRRRRAGNRRPPPYGTAHLGRARRHLAGARGPGDGPVAGVRRPRRGPRPAAAPVRARPGRAGRAGADPCHRRVDRREHLRRRRRAAALGGRARCARARGVPRGEHSGRHGRPPQPPLRELRLGRRAYRRHGQLGARAAHRPADRGVRAVDRRLAARGVPRPAPRRRPAPQPERRALRGGVRRRARGAARRRERLRDPHRAPARTRRGPRAGAGRHPPCRTPVAGGDPRLGAPRRGRTARGPARPRWPPVNGALLVAGTTSDAGKSVLTAGLCRWLARTGRSVAPFKAQNMSLNSMVTADGAEIGRAQAMQAAAARVEPEAAMNPVLLKPGSDTHSQVVLMGRPVAEVGALDYRDLKPRLLTAALEAFDSLSNRFDVVVCEGAGSPAEINLRDRDIANMGLARARDLPAIVVGDIDRGGVFASLYGTLAVLEPADQALIAGFVINKFRGDARLLAPGLDQLRALTGRPVLGTLPWVPGLWLDVEDSLDLESRTGASGPSLPPVGADVLRVAVVRLPRLSNVTDIDALAAEPGVVVR